MINPSSIPAMDFDILPHPRALIRLLAGSTLMVCLLIAQVSLAQESTSQQGDSQEQQAEFSRLPGAFSKAVPDSTSDLRDIQTHITQLVPPLKETTVNLRIGRSQGSGVLVSADGLILSAAHVTGPPGKPVIIITADGKQYSGVTLGQNTTLDGSMVQIESNRIDWPHRKVAAEPVKIGEWCLTLGHPGGYQRERGLVLRLGRVIESNDWLLQTDCELIGGDSGGPLFNMRGEVIGINTRIGESTVYNFHVPGNSFVRDWDRLRAGDVFKSHSGAYLGIGGAPAEEGEGLVIQAVEAGTPAARVGLLEGDIILTFQGQQVHDIDQLTELVGEESPGRSVRIVILRDGEQEEVIVRLGMRFKR